MFFVQSWKRETVFTIWFPTLFLLVGCADQSPEMNTALVHSALDQPGRCEYCELAIENVQQENLIVVRGNQHIVCSEECEDDLVYWLSKQ
ncbi:MAG: hypothetical protein R3C11_06670 [Planctomycetaceae bacterium]